MGHIPYLYITITKNKGIPNIRFHNSKAAFSSPYSLRRGKKKKRKEKLCRGMKWEVPVLIQTWQAQFYHCNILFDFSTKIFSDHLELLQAGGQNFVIPFQSKWQISNCHVANAQPKGSTSSLIQSSLEFYTCSKNKVLANKSAHLSIFQTEQRSCHFWTRQHFFRVWSYYPISQAGSRAFCKFH